MNADVVVAGHLCLDVIPRLEHAGERLEPGRLLEVGPAAFATGGAVANVGLALSRLGVRARLMGKVGEDAFGRILRERLERADPATAGSLRVAPGETTSYSIVISPPGMDRLFLHHPGCNDSYGAADVDRAAVAASRLFYFGYPPLMKRIYSDGGEELAALLEEIRTLGVTTVLDMAMPDPQGASGQVDWPAFLGRVLPQVDFFLPSLSEVLRMLSARPNQPGDPSPPPADLLEDLAQRLLAMGAAVVGLKLGAWGLYLRSADRARLARAGRALETAAAWAGRELWSPVFEVEVRGTTGAGDATVAGLIAGLLGQRPVEDALSLASAVGACSVEALDAVSGVRSREATLARIAQGWPRARLTPGPGAWRLDAASGVWRGPGDEGDSA